MNSNYIRNCGLYDILNAQMKYVSSTKNIIFKIDVIGDEEVLNESEQLLVYRIAQEAIQNTLKRYGNTSERHTKMNQRSSI